MCKFQLPSSSIDLCLETNRAAAAVPDKRERIKNMGMEVLVDVKVLLNGKSTATQCFVEKWEIEKSNLPLAGAAEVWHQLKNWTVNR